MFVRGKNHHMLASSSDIDPEQLLTCPYDETHRIRAKRYPHHIIKCQKNHPMADFETCPFNARHIVRRHEYRHHMSVCPEKKILEQDIIQPQCQEEEGAYFKGNTDVPPYHNPDFKMPSPTESWDLEAEESATTYPTHYNGYLATNELMTPAERKLYHKKLKEEALRKVAGRPRSAEVGNYENHVNGNQYVQLDLQDKPVRRPKEPPKVLQQQNGHSKIAANIYNQEVKQEKSCGSVPSEDMFLKASYNIASVYNQPNKVPNSVLGQAAKATVTNAYLEELNHGHYLAIMPPPPNPAGNGLLRIAPGYEHAASLPYNMPASQIPVPSAVVSSLSAVAAALSNGVPQTSVQSVNPGMGQVVASQGVSPFQNFPAGIGRGRGRGMMDLSAIKKKKVGNASQTNPPLPPGVVSSVQATGVTDRTEQSEEALKMKRQKKMHKLNKKLRQINSLEERQNQGTKLNEEEVQKVLKKDRVIEKLAKLTGLSKEWLASSSYIEQLKK